MDTSAPNLLPSTLDDIDPAFMTAVLRRSGVITGDNEVLSQTEKGVGMTAGYFSAIKKVNCTYRSPTDAPTSFVAKTWPAFEMLPREAIAAMFVKDIAAYRFDRDGFFPRVEAVLAEFDLPTNRWGLIMHDADTFAVHKVHEQELTADEVLRMVPRLAAIAAAWEGCDQGPKAATLEALGVGLWSSPANIGLFKAVMPTGAKIADKLTTMGHSSLINGRPWHTMVGGPGICELFTRKLDAFFAVADPANGATCTLAHGDFRGDNIFFCEPSERYPDGWLCVDFQLMFRGPVPSDLAYLMGSGSVLPEVYQGEALRTILRTFYREFMDRTVRYRDYTYEQFEREFATMSAVMFTYSVGMGAAIWRAGAFDNEQGARVELGSAGDTEESLTPEERRQRMWWTKCFANFVQHFVTFGTYEYLQGLPETTEGLGPWAELPAHLR